MWPQTIDKLFQEQLAGWPMAANNYSALSQVKVKMLCVPGSCYMVQFNPARIVSTSAKVDADSIRERKCFLCEENLPAEQRGVPYGTHYTILVNPFPIFRQHLTIPDARHTPQLIASRMGDMLCLAKDLNNYVITYNGPKCGASAPDHFHFQAGLKYFMPIEKEWVRKRERVAGFGEAALWVLNDTPRATLVIESPEMSDMLSLFEMIYHAMDLRPGHDEPMMNVLTWYENHKWIVCIFPRANHRPACYFDEGEHHLLISPAVIDLGGVFVTPREKDFEKITEEDIYTILSEVCISSVSLRNLIRKINHSIR